MPNVSRPKTISEYLDRIVQLTSDPRAVRFSGLGIYLNRMLDNPTRPAEIIQDMVDLCLEQHAYVSEPTGRGQNLLPKLSVDGIDKVPGLSVANDGAVKISNRGDVVKFEKTSVISKDLTRLWDLASHTSGARACNCLNDGRADNVDAFLKLNTNPEFVQHGTCEGDPYYAPAIGSNDISYVYTCPEGLKGWAEGDIPKELKDTILMIRLGAEYSVTDPELNALVHDDYRGNVGWSEDYFIMLSRPVAEEHLQWWQAELDRVHNDYPDRADEIEGTPGSELEMEQMMYYHRSCHNSVRALEKMFAVMDGTYKDDDVGEQVSALLSSLAH